MSDPILKTLDELTAADAVSDTDLLPIYQGASPLHKITFADLVVAISARGLGAAKPITKPAFIGDSVTAGSGTGNVNGWTLRYAALSGQFEGYPNYAVGGYTSAQIISVQIPQVLAYEPSHCFTQFGTNDIIQNVSPATLRTNAVTIWTTLQEAGIQPIHMGLQPVTTAADYYEACAFNLWARIYCRNNGILYIDIMPYLANGGAGAYKSGLGLDAVHPNSVGTKVMAQRVLAQTTIPYALTPPLCESDDRTFNGVSGFTMLQDNAVSMVDSNADGVPNSFNTTGSGGTYTIQNADANGYGKWARTAMTGGTAVGLTCTAQTLASLGWEIGDTIAVAFRIRWVDVSQALTLDCRFTGINGAASIVLQDEKAGTATGDDMYVYREYEITSGTVIGFQWTGTGTGYFEINRPQIFNLTKMGLA